MNNKPNNTMQLCAYEQGYRAAKAGKLIEHCPHKKHNPSRPWWINGFNAFGEAVKQL